MSGIMDFLVGLGDIIGSVITFLYGIILDLLYVISLIGSLVVKIPDLIGWLPSSCISIVVLAFAIVVIYKILGREG